MVSPLPLVVEILTKGSCTVGVQQDFRSLQAHTHQVKQADIITILEYHQLEEEE